MTTLRRCIDFLDRNRVSYAHTTHANAYRALEVAYAEDLPPHKFAKTVIFFGDHCYAMAVLPADCTVDLEELATDLGLTHIRLATEVELTRLFPECEVGAMPPLGDLFRLPVYLDERLADENYIGFNAGTHRDTIYMRFADYLCLAHAQITRFAHRELNYLLMMSPPGNIGGPCMPACSGAPGSLREYDPLISGTTRRTCVI
jgi:Ala-tRNA(Pro) deacylase